MRFEVLGPVRVADGRGTRPVVGARQRILLGALLTHVGRAVPAEQLAEFVWDGAPPGRAIPTLRTYVARLRQAIGPEAASRILTSDGGYIAEVGLGELDTLDFEELCRHTEAGIRAGDWARASDHAAEALALWRGAPLGDVPCQALRDACLPRLGQQRIQVTEWQAEAGLHMGRHESLVPQLRQLTADHPLRERFHAQLMFALCRGGRRAEALAVYHDARKLIVGELGIEPGPELRRLHERILADDDDLAGAGDPAAPRELAAVPAALGAPMAAVPRQLPAAAGHFTGRDGELDMLTSLPDQRSQPETPNGTVVISAIDGMAGIGKTALAVHAAHRLAEHFPGGQMFIDLHGYTEGHPPREPGEALGTLLRALGVPAAQIPAQPEEAAALYRQRLAGTRTLIVLDNARNEAQVRPLLPGTPGCLVLVTSRRRLKGLHDAHIVNLDVLPEADALTLLRTVITPAHAGTADPELAEIVRLCGRLPLALRIAGALLRHRPAWTPGYLIGLLRDERRRLVALADGDHNLNAVFGLSYAALDEPQRLLFRRLARVPGPDLDKFAAAALLDVGPTAAAGQLENLVDHNLLIQHAPGRYQLHDLIRAHARGLDDSDSQPGGDGALDRLLSYYAHTSQSASALIARYPRPASDGPPPAHAPVLDSPEAALVWLSAERENIQAAHDHARGLCLDRHAVALAAGLAEILCTGGPLDRTVDLHQATADTAERHGWSALRATALTDLASVLRFTGGYARAADAAGRALETYRALGHRQGEANALAELSRLWLLTGDYAQAADAAAQALEAYRALGHRHGEANALAELGRARQVTGDYAGAGDASAQALETYRALGHRQGEANALTDLANMRVMTGNLAGAADAATKALEIYRTLGYRHGEAKALTELSRAQLAAGDCIGATDAAAHALEIYRALGHRYGEANALTDLGHARLAAGDLAEAGTALSMALEMYRAAGNRNGEGWALNYRAAVAAAAGDLSRALTLYQQALALNCELSAPDGEAVALEGVGECRLSAGDAETGAAHLNQALEIYERLGMKLDIERIRARLTAISSQDS